jgi:hypothetical protein
MDKNKIRIRTEIEKLKKNNYVLFRVGERKENNNNH